MKKRTKISISLISIFIAPFLIGGFWYFLGQITTPQCKDTDYNYCRQILEEFQNQKLEKQNLSQSAFEKELEKKFNLTLPQINQLAKNFNLYAKTEYDKGLAEAGLNNYEIALSHFNSAIDLDSQKSEYHYSKAVTLYFLNDYEKALNSIEASINLTSQNPDSWALKGKLLDTMGRYEDSISAYKQALKLNPSDVGIINDIGIPLSKVGRYKEAINYFDKALSIEPNCLVCLVDKGIALIYSEKYQDAIETYSKALSFDSNNIQSYDNRGYAYYRIGEYERALEDAKKSLELSPYICRYFNVGIHLTKLGRLSEAENYFRTAKNLDSNFIEKCKV